MHAGMMQVVSVLPIEERPPLAMVGMGPPKATHSGETPGEGGSGDHGGHSGMDMPGMGGGR